MSIIRINRCYDSHTHLLATGQMLSTLQLKGLKSPEAIRDLQLHADFYRQDWLVGFGWDQHLFPDHRFPTRQHLDAIFPSHPVVFTRTDGHAMWVNTEALKRCGLFKPVLEMNLPAGAEAVADTDGFPTGILIDRAMELVYQTLPPDDFAQKKKSLLKSIQKFNRAGFTHLRDMSGDLDQWKALRELEKSGELTLYIDQNFSFERPQDFPQALALCLEAAKEGSRKIWARGIKFYVDGALGSEGALLSQEYPGSSSKGLLLWEPEQIQQWIRAAWEAKVEVSIHALGDQASWIVAKAARELWQRGVRGRLNVEHAEVMGLETILLLQGMDVRVHLQPCHWLSDHRWLSEKLGHLAKSAFPWEALQKREIPIYWGSDAPIEEPSLFDNQRALQESRQAGIPSPQGEWWKPHEHPDALWGRACFTKISEDGVKEVSFNGRLLPL